MVWIQIASQFGSGFNPGDHSTQGAHFYYRRANANPVSTNAAKSFQYKKEIIVPNFPSPVLVPRLCLVGKKPSLYCTVPLGTPWQAPGKPSPAPPGGNVEATFSVDARPRTCIPGTEPLASSMLLRLRLSTCMHTALNRHFVEHHLVEHRPGPISSALLSA